MKGGKEARRSQIAQSLTLWGVYTEAKVCNTNTHTFIGTTETSEANHQAHFQERESDAQRGEGGLVGPKGHVLVSGTSQWQAKDRNEGL